MSSAVILAAGLSSRMRQFKPLLPFGSSTLIETTIGRLREGGVGAVIVVTGFLAPEVERTLQGQEIRFVHNPNFARSQMFDSAKLGIMAAGQDDLFVLPADLPQFSPKLLRQLLGTDADAAYPVCAGANGHPLLLRRRALDRVLRHDGQRGLKGALDALHTIPMETADYGCLLDIDTPEDYFQLRAFRANASPTEGECEELFRRFQTPARVRRHCDAVCRVALRLAAGLPNIDLTLLETAARIHDAARTERHHAQTLANMLCAMGYDRIAGVVDVHMDLPGDESGCLSESALLYLADKLVAEDAEVSLQEKFEKAEQRFAHDPEALAAIRRRKAIAQRIFVQVEALHQIA